MHTEVVHNAHTVVRSSGEIDLSNYLEFERALFEAADSAPDGFILDLSDTTYIDSAGIQSIFRVYARMRESKGPIVVVMGNVRIRTVLQVVRLDQLPSVFVCDNLESAEQTLFTAKQEIKG